MRTRYNELVYGETYQDWDEKTWIEDEYQFYKVEYADFLSEQGISDIEQFGYYILNAPDIEWQIETLRREGALRGCVGSIEATRPLVVDLAENAYRAACADGRFLPVAETELADLEVHVSLLSPLERLTVSSEEELLDRIRPGVDGLVLTEGSFRGTFLPAVWESLPDPRAFVRELKRKAGLPPDHWSDRLQIDRYTVESIP